MERIFEFSGNHPFLITALVVMIFVVAFHEFRRRAQGTTGLVTGDAVRLINRGALVVDVREPGVFATGHIVHARNHPATGLKNNPELLAKQRKKTLLLVCDTGTASGRAAGELRKQGHEQVFNLQGGLNAWRQENLPLVKGEDKGKPNDPKPRHKGKQGPRQDKDKAPQKAQDKAQDKESTKRQDAGEDTGAAV
jgi:rhodanese-related sulfurtransferase